MHQRSGVPVPVTVTMLEGSSVDYKCYGSHDWLSTGRHFSIVERLHSFESTYRAGFFCAI